LSGGKYAARVKALRRKLLDDNPFLWLAMRGEASQARVWLFVLSVLAIWLVSWTRLGSFSTSGEVVLPTVIILHTGLKIWFVGEASRRFVEDRRNNAMEFLLSTPLNERQIVNGQWRALGRQFLWPAVAVLVWEVFMVAAMFHAPNRGWDDARERYLPQLLCAIFFLPVDCVALGWAGMWLGMTSKGRGRAMLTGLAVVVLLPWVLTQIFMTLSENFGLLGYVKIRPMQPNYWENVRTFVFVCISLMTNAVVIIWTSAHLLMTFRRQALATFSR
jgi:hypothetical protein